MTEIDPILGAALAAICSCLGVAIAAYWLSGDWRQTFTAAGDDVLIEDVERAEYDTALQLTMPHDDLARLQSVALFHRQDPRVVRHGR